MEGECADPPVFTIERKYHTLPGITTFGSIEAWDRHNRHRGSRRHSPGALALRHMDWQAFYFLAM